jgi:hypothetical protein
LQDVHIFPLPDEGDIVTFSYHIYSRATIPLKPEITRIRPDLTWDDVLLSHANEERFLNGKAAFN